VGEGRTGADNRADERLTLREAAARLGVSESAIRKRVERGTLRSDKGPDGKRYVYLRSTVADTMADTGADMDAAHVPSSYAEALLSEMRDRVAFLERELERKDAILLNMTEAMKAIAPPANEEPLQEASEAPQTATEQPGRGGAQTPLPEAQEGEQRPWWRRWFGT
jgi:hypothetical protein